MRRTAGPKRRAERYAAKVLSGGIMGTGITANDIVTRHIRGLIASAYLKGYASCARARRKDLSSSVKDVLDAGGWVWVPPGALPKP